MDKENLTLAVALVAMLIAIGAYFYPQAAQLAGSVGTRFPNGLAVGSTASVTQNKLTIGNSGTAIGNAYFGICSLIAGSYSLTATTTVAMDCAVSAAVSGDIVQGWFATTTPSTGGPGWLITQAAASSTSGFVTFNVTNLTGATAVIPASVASTTRYLGFR